MTIGSHSFKSSAINPFVSQQDGVLGVVASQNATPKITRNQFQNDLSRSAIPSRIDTNFSTSSKLSQNVREFDVSPSPMLKAHQGRLIGL